MPAALIVAILIAAVIAVAALLVLARRRSAAPAGLILDPEDPRFLAAKQQARASLPDFWAAHAAAAPGDSDFMVKFDLNHGRGLADRESIWADIVSLDDGAIQGRLANPPRNRDFREGDIVKIAPEAIDDWAFMRNGVAQGHFVTRVMIEVGPPAMAREAKQALGW